MCKSREVWRHLVCSGIHRNQGVCGYLGCGIRVGPDCTPHGGDGTGAFQVGRVWRGLETAMVVHVLWVPVAGATSENWLEGGVRDFVFNKFSVWLLGASVSFSLNWGQSEMSRLPGKSWLSNCRHSLILLPCLFQPPAS